MRIIEDNQNTMIEDISHFNLTQTLECGQCFRFHQIEKLEYIVIAKGSLLHIKQIENNLVFYNTSRHKVENVWLDYFDLNRNYGEIKEALLGKDERIRTAIEEKYGVRILNQDFHEVLITFIISQNKQIPHIKQIIARISKQYGRFLGQIDGEEYYDFPTLHALKNITEQQFRDMKTGFRAPYLVDAISKLAEGLSAESLQGFSYGEAKEELLKIKGVGAKVANCVLLFGLGYRNAFPVDVWVKRAMESVYFKKETPVADITTFARETFGEYGGYAQQYLFYYTRDKKIS